MTSNVGWLVLHVLQRHPGAGVPLLAILVVQHRVAVRERAAADVLAGQPHAVALVEQRRVGERLAHAPVERQLALAHRAAVGDHLLDARMQLEAVGHRRERFARAPCSVFSGTRVSHGVGPVPALERRPVDRERRLVVRQDRRVGVLAPCPSRRGRSRSSRRRRPALITPAAIELVGVELARARMLRDLLVHQRLRDHRLVGLVVAEPAEADEVDEHVLVELLPVLERDLDREQARPPGRRR